MDQSSLNLGSVQVFLGQKVPTALIKPEDIEDLGQNVEATDGEAGLGESECSECGNGFT
jgi:hypothetical protein